MLSTIKEYILDPTLLLVLILVYALYTFLISNFDYWLVQGVPYRKPLPILGNFAEILLFRTSQFEGIIKMYNWFKNERFFGVYQLRSPVLFVRDPELIKCIFIKDFNYFYSRGIPFNFKNPLNAHLFNLEGKPWRSLRTKLTSVFSSKKIKEMFYLLTECSDNLTECIEREIKSSKNGESAVLEMHQLAMDYTVDVIGSCAFGIQINALTQDSDFRKIANTFSKSSYRTATWRMLRTTMPKLYKLLNIQVVDNFTVKFFLNMVSQIIKEREEKGTKRYDFMDLLIEIKNTQSNEFDNGNIPKENDDLSKIDELVMDNNLIAAQAFVFFLAGFDTASSAISFCLYELALNQDIQDKARNDIIDSLNKHDGKFTFDAIQDMKYLEMVVYEALRKYPVAASLSRRCVEPYKLPGTDIVLPKNMKVIIPVAGIHHDPKYYPEPSVFRPERFEEDEKGARPPCTFLSFGDGPKSCIGVRFGLLQAKIGVLSFLKKFKIEICDKTEIPLKYHKYSFVISGKNGIWLKMSKYKN